MLFPLPGEPSPNPAPPCPKHHSTSKPSPNVTSSEKSSQVSSLGDHWALPSTLGPTSPDHLVLVSLQLPKLITEILDEEVAVLVVGRVIVGHDSGGDAQAPQHWEGGQDGERG